MKNWHIILITIAISILLALVTVWPAGMSRDINAAGLSSANYNVHGDETDGRFYSSLDQWDDMHNGSATWEDTNFLVGWQEYLPGGDEWQVNNGLVGFNAPYYIGTYDSGYVYIYISSIQYTVPWDAVLALYMGTLDNTPTVTNADWDNAYDQGSVRISDYRRMQDYAADEFIKFRLLDIPETEPYLEGDAHGVVWFWVLTTNYSINIEPPQSGNETWSKSEQYYHETVDGNRPKLEIFYQSEENSRDSEPVGPNAGLTISENTTGITDNITWQSTRCAYADEDLQFIVEGTPGTPIALKLLKRDSTELNSVTTWIQDDGIYYWSPDMPSDTDSFVIVYDMNSGVSSSYGYVSPSPDESQDKLSVMAVDTLNNHSVKEMSYFITNVSDRMAFHWRTNIDGDTELANYDINIYKNGDYGQPVYTLSFQSLADDYFSVSANNTSQLHWRYALFTMDGESGFNDFEGLIIDLNQEPSYTNRGFYTLAITDNGTDNAITSPKDAYWYIGKESDGVVLSTRDMTDTVYMDIIVGDPCKVKDDLSGVEAYLILPDGSLTWEHIGSVSATSSYLNLESYPHGTGDWYAHIEFSGANTDFVYIRDILLNFVSQEEPTVIPPGGGIKERAEEQMTDWGLDNTAGRWTIIVVAMLLFFGIFYRSELMRVMMPLLILALGIIYEWTDIWLIVLLALGAGLTLFGLLRKKVAGGGGGQ